MSKFFITLFFICACFLAPIKESIAQGSTNCEQEMTEANDLYARGQFDQTIALIDQCLAKEGIPEEERRAAYRLKGLSFIGKGLEGDAKASVRRLLDLVPNYEPDPILDPPDFVSMVDEIKAELDQSSTTSSPSNRRVTASTNGPERKGFTFLVSIGVGFQSLQADPGSGLENENATGLGGLNLGLGGFLTNKLALMARVSGTNVNHDIADVDFSILSGTIALTLQYWINDQIFIEAGPGRGFGEVSAETVFGSVSENETGFGLLVGGGFVIYNKGKNNIHIGIEYAPAFLEGLDINNIGVTVGYQLL